MLSKGGNNEILAEWGERNDPNASVFAALHATDQALREEAVHGDTDRTWSQIDDRAYRIDRQRSFVEQGFQHAEIRQAESSFFNTAGCIPCQGAHGFHHYEPGMVRRLNTFAHKKPESSRSIRHQFY